MESLEHLRLLPGRDPRSAVTDGYHRLLGRADDTHLHRRSRGGVLERVRQKVGRYLADAEGVGVHQDGAPWRIEDDAPVRMVGRVLLALFPHERRQIDDL